MGSRAGRFAGAALLALVVAACRQDMHDQPSYSPYEESSFFADGQSARPLVAGTVARGQLKDDPLLYTGKEGEEPATVFPFPVDEKVMTRGQERFNIYCALCHGRAGDGEGIIPQRGFQSPPTFHQDRLREAPASYYFTVITNGFGAMPSYATEVPPQDRWAIIAYIRALQLSQNATIEDVPQDRRGELEE